MMTFHLSRKIKNQFSWKQGMFFWYRHYKGMFFVGFLAVLCLGGFFWYRYLYQYHWTEEQKKTYIEQHFKETQFKEQAFESTVGNLGTRARLHESTPLLSRNIFSGSTTK